MYSATRQPGRRDKYVIVGLIILSLVPALAGIVRVVSLAGGETVNAENERFHAAPLPVILHIAASLFYCLAGAFQFAPGFRAKHGNWHRQSGRFIAAAGLVSAITGLVMTLTYSAAANDGPALFYIRLIIAPAMVVCLLAGVYAVMKKNLQGHGVWMLRAYALGQGAGTQVFTHIGYMLLVATPTGHSRDAMMALGWLINIVVAEWIIWRRRRRSVVSIG